MQRKAAPAEIPQDRQLAVLLDLALSLESHELESSLSEAAGCPELVRKVLNLLGSEPGDDSFLSNLVTPPGIVEKINFGSNTEALTWSGDGPVWALATG